MLRMIVVFLVVSAFLLRPQQSAGFNANSEDSLVVTFQDEVRLTNITFGVVSGKSERTVVQCLTKPLRGKVFSFFVLAQQIQYRCTLVPRHHISVERGSHEYVFSVDVFGDAVAHLWLKDFDPFVWLGALLAKGDLEFLACVVYKPVRSTDVDNLSSLVVVKEGVQHQVLLQFDVPVELVSNMLLMEQLQLEKLFAKEGANKFSFDAILV